MLQQISWPPLADDSQLEILIRHIHDWQLTHSSLLKLVWTEQDYTVLIQPIGASLYPTLFPRSSFEQALRIQKDYNALYATIASDETWIHETLKPLMTPDSFASKLWGIHEKVKAEGYVQDISLGIFRSDYMLHSPSPSPNSSSNSTPKLKQVEFNTFSCAGSCHSSQISSLHRHLTRTRAYPSSPFPSLSLSVSNLPPPPNIPSLAAALASAHQLYGPPKSRLSTQTGILITVQPNNVNTADERPLEYALWDSLSPSHPDGIPCYRVVFPGEVIAHTSLTSNRELLYHPPARVHAGLGPLEVSVVYMRAGYDEAEYSDSEGKGVGARYMIERSRAIKCPSLMGHLGGFKMVQMKLGEEGVVRRFLSGGEGERNRDQGGEGGREGEVRGTGEREESVLETFMPMYPLDGSTRGVEGWRIATDPKAAGSYVLKPSLEGGGHNVYGEKIPPFLSSIPKEKWGEYILMEKIRPPTLKNVLMSPRGLYRGNVVSELGVLGVCLWKTTRDGSCEMIMNEQAGFTFKTKASDIDEMSVVKGYGCFDSPCLVDDERGKQ